MRHVTKVGLGTNALSAQHASPPATAADARVRWDRFDGKAVLMEHWLLTEQYSLCCYSEARADELGIGYPPQLSAHYPQTAVHLLAPLPGPSAGFPASLPYFAELSQLIAVKPAVMTLLHDDDMSSQGNKV